MDASWLQLRGPVEVRPGRIEARASIPASSPFFSGHFPDNPVVPGIALLGLVKLALAGALPGREVTGFRRVKFRRVHQRGGEFDVGLEVGAGRDFKFEVATAGELLCDGLVTLTELTAGRDDSAA